MGRVHRHAGVPTNEGLSRKPRGIVRSIGGESGGSGEKTSNSGSVDAELSRAAKAINTPKSGGLKENH